MIILFYFDTMIVEANQELKRQGPTNLSYPSDVQALQDPNVQHLALDQYGFRSGVLGRDNDKALLKEIDLPEHIVSDTPLPSPEEMNNMLNARC